MVTTRWGASSAKSNENLHAPQNVNNEGLLGKFGVARHDYHWLYSLTLLPMTPTLWPWLVEKPGRKRRRPQKLQNDNEDSDGLAPGPSRNPGSAKTEQIVRRNGNRGKLRDMMDMPIDIFTEVGYHSGQSDDAQYLSTLGLLPRGPFRPTSPDPYLQADTRCSHNQRSKTHLDDSARVCSWSSRMSRRPQ